MTGREPSENKYFSSKVIWLLVVLVGVALIVVGVMVTAELPGGPIPQQDKDISSSVAAIDSSGLSSIIDTGTILPELIQWKNYDDGMAAINGTNMFAIIYFTSDDCQPCREIEKQTFSSDNVLSAMRNLIIPIKIESNSSRKMTYAGRIISESHAADIFDIPGYPTLLFYDGRENHFLFMQPGFVNTTKLIAIFDYLRDRIFNDSTVTLDQYLKSKNID